VFFDQKNGLGKNGKDILGKNLENGFKANAGGRTP